MKKYNYAMIVSYNFADDTRVELFEDFEEAKAYLIDDIKNEHNLDIENNRNSNLYLDEESGYGKICVSGLFGVTEITEYSIALLSEYNFH